MMSHGPDQARKPSYLCESNGILRYAAYYRKRGSGSYIVREWLLWVVERERERERDACDVIRYHAEIASDHAYDYLDGASRTRRRESTRKLKDKKLGAWALEQQGRDEWRWVAEGKLCISLVSLPFAGEPAVIYPVPFRVDRTRRRVQSLSSARVHDCSLPVECSSAWLFAGEPA